MNNLEDYKYLWDGSSPGWGLVQINADKSDELPRYAIFNAETKRALLIRDDHIYDEVKKKMIESGVRVIEF
ncbi:hypothetical protein [Chromobacterium haemolyticum]|uniref:Uncharacterized protein n=1 Tax=Chromobacterium haemolyticum TaxID=394935 RepID=A0A1W0D7Y4_9NEIS|nr:hypothetical protein [Chromobacterium haemolyticum]OQS43058.1 hypothetical protein B0T45_03560 [Chromobacterium haemolyticum]